MPPTSGSCEGSLIAADLAIGLLLIFHSSGIFDEGSWCEESFFENLLKSLHCAPFLAGIFTASAKLAGYAPLVPLTSTFFPILVPGISQRNLCSKLHRTARIINPASASRLIRRPASEIIRPTRSNSCKPWSVTKLRADGNSRLAVKSWKSFDRSGTRKFKPGLFMPSRLSTSWSERSRTD